MKIQSDFETMGYLAVAYTSVNQLEEASGKNRLMVEAEPDHLSTWITRANLACMMERYESVIEGTTQV